MLTLPECETVTPAIRREYIAAHPGNLKKRFILCHKETGAYLCTVYAERFEQFAASCGHFYVGNDVVGSAELAYLTVTDSGGRLWENKSDLIARIKHDLRLLADLDEC